MIAKYVERLLASRRDRAGRPRNDRRATMPFSPIPEAIEDIRAGRMVVVVDDEDRENEGDLTIAAEKVTPEIINFMARHGRGLICLPMTGERLDELRIPLMVQDDENSAKFGTAFCVPIEAKQGTTTGISAADRARTVLAAIDPRHAARRTSRGPGTCSRCARPDGGVLVRAGQTEAAVDLARLAGLNPGGRHLRDHGRGRHHGPRAAARARSAAQHGLKHDHDQGPDPAPDERPSGWCARSAEANLPTGYGAFRIHAFESLDRRRSTTWPSCMGDDPTRGPACWCASTPSA